MEDQTKRNDMSEKSDRIINLGVAITTTSRKFMNGNHSSVLYNTIMLIDAERWTRFLEKVISGLDQGQSLRTACHAAVEYGSPVTNLLGVAFKMMDEMSDWKRDEDDGPGWASMESGIKHCKGWPEVAK